jgi:GntR family transcriptional regulator / MocR family aminotransferase
MEPLVQLPIRMPARGGRNLAATLHAQLRRAILDGRLRNGVRLPSTRALSAAHGISRNTVLAAFDMLLSEGYVRAQRGSGTTVVYSLAKHAVRRNTQANADSRLNSRWLRAKRSRPEGPTIGAPMYSFQVGTPDTNEFPYEVWRRLSNRAVRNFGAASRRELDTQGLPALRAGIAAHVSVTRAVACEPDDVVVTSGAQQAFDLLARTLIKRGRSTVALENPGYPPIRSAFASHGATIAPVPVDHDGMMVEHIPKRARIVCVSPSHQFPLGAVLSPERRAALLAACERRGSVVIEDDYDAEFRFADRPLDALQTMDRTDSVFYVGTFSKILLPHLRLGYIVTPSWAREALIQAKGACDGGCNTLTQATLALLIAEGHLTRHVRRVQRIYARRRQLILDQLSTHCRDYLEPLPSIAGLHVAARFTTPCADREIVAELRRQGIQVHALAPFYVGKPQLQGLLLGYGATSDASIGEGVRHLADGLRRLCAVGEKTAPGRRR